MVKSYCQKQRVSYPKTPYALGHTVSPKIVWLRKANQLICTKPHCKGCSELRLKGFEYYAKRFRLFIRTHFGTLLVRKFRNGFATEAYSHNRSEGDLQSTGFQAGTIGCCGVVPRITTRMVFRF